jgi:hypothetical protein
MIFDEEVELVRSDLPRTPRATHATTGRGGKEERVGLPDANLCV